MLKLGKINLNFASPLRARYNEREICEDCFLQMGNSVSSSILTLFQNYIPEEIDSKTTFSHAKIKVIVFSRKRNKIVFKFIGHITISILNYIGKLRWSLPSSHRVDFIDKY